MSILHSLYLIILLWIGLPLTLTGLVTYISGPIDNTTPWLVFLLYIIFSWTIALMIFVMETSRQKLFQPSQPIQSALRLGLYASVAIVLSMLANPTPALFSATEKMITITVVFGYGCLMGYIYQRLMSR